MGINDFIKIGARIKKTRIEKGLSQREMAKTLGIPYSTYSNYENDNREPSSCIISKISKVLDITPAYLMGWESHEKERFSSVPNILPIETQKIPLLGTIAAGEPILAEENFECYVELGAKVKADYALRVKGDSMINARINDGDIVFIRQQKAVANGEIAAVLLEDENEATLKRFYQYGNIVVLHFENPAYKDIEINLEEGHRVQILGRAVAFQSDVR